MWDKKARAWPGARAWILALALTAGLAAPASAAGFTLTTSGRISYGFDFGVFGIPGSLRGHTYSITQTYELADLSSLESFLPDADRQIGLYVASAASVTVAGMTRSLVFGSAALNRVLLENGINPTTGDPFGYDQIYTDQMLVTDPIIMTVQQVINTVAEDILPGSGLDQTLAFQAAPGVNIFAYADYVEFTAPGQAIGFYFYAGIDPIPAPTAIVLFGAALVGLAVVGSRAGRR